MKIRTEKVINSEDWSEFVRETYKRPYDFQQQEGCRGRGNFRFSVPDKEASDFKNKTIPEIINHDKMGVSFAAWLKRDPKQPLSGKRETDGNEKWGIELWWFRNFYPDFGTLVNDLHKKGLIEAGKYTINIDW